MESAATGKLSAHEPPYLCPPTNPFGRRPPRSEACVGQVPITLSTGKEIRIYNRRFKVVPWEMVALKTESWEVGYKLVEATL